MNVAIPFISLILLFLPFIVHSNDESTGNDEKGPGSSACMWQGDFDITCNIAPVPADKIPEQCTSIFFESVKVNMEYRVSLTNDSQKEHLESLLQNNKRVILYYHQTGGEVGWLQVLKHNTIDGGKNAKCEMEGLKAFFEQYPGITGLIFDFVPPGMFNDDYPNPSENFKVYLEVMKNTFPDLILGISVPTGILIDFYANPSGQWFDFNIIDSLLDFYVADLYYSAQCTPDLISTGAFPLTGNYTYTAEKAMSLLDQAKIPKEKRYIMYSLSAATGDTKFPPYYCQFSYTWICTHPEDSSDLCADTQATYVEKGAYAAKNANGFIADIIDIDDPGAVCGCGDPSNPSPFPGFMALLDGFYGTNTVQPCPKFDRTGT